ncbi:XRE family transcriptional regulator [Saccharopolyspora erythraea]|uniref:RICIN domain-containing protein n=1 Tax=Saccharopolyspora erythraea TaxID=1836 RepID=UPI001BA63208|nr:helix-turn-helix domain-containing protein [Saccharopolyspora erythraea]QUH02402.1 XRE family transcriptional regulator [Saccharopolyspora erythraea]
MEQEISPHQARDADEFIALLRRLKQRSGLTYRQLEERAAARGQVLARSTLADVLGGKRLPRPELLAVFLHACGRGDEVPAWLRARDALADREISHGAGESLASTEPDAARDAAQPAGDERARSSSRRYSRALLPFVAAVAVMAAATTAVWMLLPSDGPGENTAVTGAAVGRPAAGERVRLRPVAAPRLCLTDGQVRDGRYSSLVAVQRPCEEIAPQTTVLEPVGGDLRRIQWHHPGFGTGCLKALTDGPAAGLLEPWDACEKASSFRLQPTEVWGRGAFALRVQGQGCVGIAASDTAEGAEAVVEPCTGAESQAFLVEPAP